MKLTAVTRRGKRERESNEILVSGSQYRFPSHCVSACASVTTALRNSCRSQEERVQVALHGVARGEQNVKRELN